IGRIACKCAPLPGTRISIDRRTTFHLFSRTRPLANKYSKKCVEIEKRKTAVRGDKRWPPQGATSCRFGGTRTSCPSEVNPVKSPFDFIGLTEATSSPCRLELDNRKA